MVPLKIQRLYDALEPVLIKFYEENNEIPSCILNFPTGEVGFGSQFVAMNTFEREELIKLRSLVKHIRMLLDSK